MSKEIKIVRGLAESRIISLPPKIIKAMGIDINTVLEIEQVGNSIVMIPILNQHIKEVN